MARSNRISPAVAADAAILRNAAIFYTTEFMGRGKFEVTPQPTLAAAFAAKAQNKSLMVYAESAKPEGGTGRSALIDREVLIAYETLYGESAV